MQITFILLGGRDNDCWSTIDGIETIIFPNNVTTDVDITKISEKHIRLAGDSANTWSTINLTLDGSNMMSFQVRSDRWVDFYCDRLSISTPMSMWIESDMVIIQTGSNFSFTWSWVTKRYLFNIVIPSSGAPNITLYDLTNAPVQFKLNGTTRAQRQLEFFAPTTGGTAGQFLKSTGPSVPPIWSNPSAKTEWYDTTSNNVDVQIYSGAERINGFAWAVGGASMSITPSSIAVISDVLSVMFNFVVGSNGWYMEQFTYVTSNGGTPKINTGGGVNGLGKKITFSAGSGRFLLNFTRFPI